MFGLQSGQALIDENHPVHKEYVKPGGGALLRFFPKSGNDGKTIVELKEGSQSEQFVTGLGELQLIFICVHLTDLILTIPAGQIRRWKLAGQHGAPADDDLRQAPFHVPHASAPFFNQLFAALYDLIFSGVTKVGLLVPGPGRTIQDIFAEKITTGDDGNKKKWLVSAELIAYLQWLIYTAPFKSPEQGARGVVHAKYYIDWVASFTAPGKEKAYRKELQKALEIWYEKHPATKASKRKRSSAATSPSIIVEEGLPLESDSDEGGGDDGALGASAGGGAAAGAGGGGGASGQ
jgi:hypothetical protein